MSACRPCLCGWRSLNLAKVCLGFNSSFLTRPKSPIYPPFCLLLLCASLRIVGHGSARATTDVSGAITQRVQVLPSKFFTAVRGRGVSDITGVIQKTIHTTRNFAVWVQWCEWCIPILIGQYWAHYRTALKHAVQEIHSAGHEVWWWWLLLLL